MVVSAKNVKANNINGNDKIRELAMLFLKGKHSYHYEAGFLPLTVINVFPQPRKTFEGIHDLSLDLVQKGIMNPHTVAQFTKQSCVEHIERLNRIQKTNFTIDDAKPYRVNGQESYYVLIAGERRLRGWFHTWPEEREKCPQCKEMMEFGCETCRKDFGVGPCYHRHFGDKPVTETEVRLCVGINPLEAFFLQLSENTHMSVPPHEEAKAYAQFFGVLHQEDDSFTVSRFAAMVGRSADKVRNAIRFCELPTSIQRMVEDSVIPYGIAIELTRLYAGGVSEKELDWWSLESIARNFKVCDFNKTISEFLKNRASGQNSLFDIFSEEQQKEMSRHHFRIVVEKQYIQAIWSYIHYFNRVAFLFEEGKLGKTDSPFSVRSPRKVFRTLVNDVLLNRLLPHIRSLVPKDEQAVCRQILEETTKYIDILEEKLPEETQ